MFSVLAVGYLFLGGAGAGCDFGVLLGGGVLGHTVAHTVLGGVAQGGLGHVHAHNLEILKAL